MRKGKGMGRGPKRDEGERGGSAVSAKRAKFASRVVSVWEEISPQQTNWFACARRLLMIFVLLFSRASCFVSGGARPSLPR